MLLSCSAGQSMVCHLQNSVLPGIEQDDQDKDEHEQVETHRLSPFPGIDFPLPFPGSGVPLGVLAARTKQFLLPP